MSRALLTAMMVAGMFAPPSACDVDPPRGTMHTPRMRAGRRRRREVEDLPAEDRERIERAKAKRERKAAARRSEP